METISLQTKKESTPATMVRNALIACGVISSLYYVAINIIVPFYYPGYSLSSQTVSELSAIDAPSRSLWVSLCIIYSLLVIGFSLGIWLSSSENRRLRIVAILMMIYAVSGFFWPPMHRREVLAAGGGTLTDTLHIVYAMATVLLMIFMIVLGARALDKRFSIYSILTLIVLIAFGILTSLDGPRIGENLATPWIGVWERINIGVFMLWVIILSFRLISKR
jgi:hypothetical membrane protein